MKGEELRVKIIFQSSPKAIPLLHTPHFTLYTLRSTLNAQRSALFHLIVPQIIGEIKKNRSKKERTAMKLSVFALLQALLVGLDHFLDHLAADGAGFPGGQVAVVAVLQVHTDLPWCPSY